MKVLVTGANGFVGRAVLACVSAMNGMEAVATVRRLDALTELGASVVAVGDLSAQTDWSSALVGVDAVVHAAARVHVINDKCLDPLAEFCRVNVEGTAALARQAEAAGVKRFVFLSSIKVNGEFTEQGQPFTADDLPAPIDPYGMSKLEAEQGLREIEAQTGMEVVIVRPPLVYGPGVKANFALMMSWLERGIPLPLGAIHNARSVVALDNLVDLLVTCLKHPAAAGQTFLVSDGEDISTTELLRRTAEAMGRKAVLWPVPTFILEWGATLVGKRAVAQRLCGSLQVDINKTRQLLGWTPRVSVDDGLRRATEVLIQ